MKKTMVYLCSLSLFSLSIFIGCKKYDAGGLASKGQQRLVSQTWELNEYIIETYQVIEDDETELIGSENSNQDLLISNYNITFFENGTVIRNYVDASGISISETGLWNIDQAGTFGLISFTNLDTIQFTNELTSLSTYFEIEKIKNKQLWLNCDQENHSNIVNNIGSEWENHLFKLIPKN